MKEFRMPTSHADRGKWAEKEFDKYMQKLVIHGDTAFYRLPDAHAGSMKATLADFIVAYRGAAYLIEVKEVDHSFRLPHKNFADDKRGRMNRFKLAGWRTFVLVYFKPEKAWRAAELGFFDTKTGGSWDMRQFPLSTLNQLVHRESELVSHANTE